MWAVLSRSSEVSSQPTAECSLCRARVSGAHCSLMWLLRTGYGLEVDLWALGVVTYILLCGFPPFRSPQRRQSELFRLIRRGEYDFISPYWDHVSLSTHMLSMLSMISHLSAFLIWCLFITLLPATCMPFGRRNERVGLTSASIGVIGPFWFIELLLL